MQQAHQLGRRETSRAGHGVGRIFNFLMIGDKERLQFRIMRPGQLKFDLRDCWIIRNFHPVVSELVEPCFQGAQSAPPVNPMSRAPYECRPTCCMATVPELKSQPEKNPSTSTSIS